MNSCAHTYMHSCMHKHNTHYIDQQTDIHRDRQTDRHTMCTLICLHKYTHMLACINIIHTTKVNRQTCNRCMHACVHTQACTHHRQAHAHPRKHTHVHIHIHTHVHIHTHIHIHTYSHTCTHTHTHTRICTHTYLLYHLIATGLQAISSVITGYPMASALGEVDFIASTGFVNSTETHVYLYISNYLVVR